MSWRYLETSRNYLFWLRLAQYFMYIRYLKFFSRWNNANYLVYINGWWKPWGLAYFLQFWTDIFPNLLNSQRIDSTPIKLPRKHLSLYYKKDFANKRNDCQVYPSISTARYGIQSLDITLWWQRKKRNWRFRSSKKLRTTNSGTEI